MYTVPCSHDLLNSIKVPLGLIIQPMASVKSNEVPRHVCAYTLLDMYNILCIVHSVRI